MPPLEPSPPALIERFDAVAARFPEAQRKKMFGYLKLFIGGNLVTGLYADRWMIRLPPDDLAELMALPGGGPFSPKGKTMSGYGTVPTDIVADDTALDGWIRRAIAHARMLPAK